MLFLEVESYAFMLPFSKILLLVVLDLAMDNSKTMEDIFLICQMAENKM